MKPFSNIFLLLVLLIPLALEAQMDPNDAERNLLKYWRHRQQLVADPATNTTGFLFRSANPGTTPGASIPAWNRVPYDVGGWAGTQNDDDSRDLQNGDGAIFWGADGTIALGYYIGVLATEWRLLSDAGRGADAVATAQELWEALEAYERLDSTAETWFDSTGVLDGFFLRDDVPMGSQQLFPLNSTTHLASMSSHATKFVSNPGHVNAANSFTSGPSGDQITFLMMGAALVRALFPTAQGQRVVVNGDDLRLKAQMMAHRIVMYAKGDIFAPGWTPNISIGGIQTDFYRWKFEVPNGNEPPYGHKNVHVSFGIAESINYIIDNDARTQLPGFFLDNYHDYTTATIGSVLWLGTGVPYNFSVVPDRDYCADDMIRAFQIQTNLPDWFPSPTVAYNNWLDTLAEGVAGQCWNASDDQHMSLIHAWLTMGGNWISPDSHQTVAVVRQLELYPLLANIFHGDALTLAFKEDVHDLLDAAPCEKFCGADDPNNVPNPPFLCNNTAEWMSSARWHHPTSANNPGDFNGDHNGLDFMLLYNCYLLANGGPPLGYAPAYIDDVRNIDFDMPRSILGLTCTFCGVDPNPRNLWAWDELRSTSEISAVLVSPDPENGVVNFRAGETIRLFPGFAVEQGASFSAVIDEFQCDLNDVINKTVPPKSAESSELLLSEMSEAPGLIVFPNPNQGRFRVQLQNLEGPSDILVINAMGKTVWHEQIEVDETAEIDLNHAATGVYFVRVINGAQILTSRVVYE